MVCAINEIKKGGNWRIVDYAYYNELKNWNSTYKYQKEMEKIADIIRLRKTTCNSKTRILDYGCGTGRLVMYLKDIGYNSQGIDIWDPEARCIKQLKSDKLPFKNNSFDFVVFMHSISHIKNPKYAVSEAYRVLKKEGCILILTPNPIFLMCYWLINLFTGYKKDRTLYKHYSVHSLRKLFKTIKIKDSVYYYGRFPFCKEAYDIHVSSIPAAFRERIMLHIKKTR